MSNPPAVVTLTLNPALDLSADVPQVRPGPKLRTGPVTAEAGGGGLNVARVVAELGGTARAVALLGGPTGARLAALLAGVPGLELVALPAPGDTRESFSITDRQTGAQYRFVLPGPQFDPAAAPALIAALAATVPAGAVTVLSGSQPPGLPDELPQGLARALPAGARLIVDTSGAALARLLDRPHPAAAPALLRLDEVEARRLSPCDSAAQAADLARHLVGAGVAQAVAVARGAAGSVLATAQGAWSCTPPPVEVVSKIGAGDSFVGALALALAQGQGWDAALRRGTAAAAAAVTTPGTQMCSRAQVDRLEPLCRLIAA